MTSKTDQQRSKGQTVRFAMGDCNITQLLIGATANGICLVRLGDDKNRLWTDLTKEVRDATFSESDKRLQQWIKALVDYLDGTAPWPMLPYDLKATAFQHKVWNWLRSIPAGQTYNYHDVAKAIGRPKAARAVAGACAVNPVALVIPCHRIVPKSGGVGGYRWGRARKTLILELEKHTIIKHFDRKT